MNRDMPNTTAHCSPTRTKTSVRLVPFHDEALKEAASGVDLESVLSGVRVGDAGDLLREVAAATLRHYARHPRRDPWGSYLTVDDRTCLIVGVCSFKFAPTPDGEVEIAYYTFPGHEGKGYATAAAARLVDIAKSSGVIKTVIAHTLPEENASTRVLTRNGFASSRKVVTTDEGDVWRWGLGS